LNNYLQLTLTENSHYWYKTATTIEMCILSYFLISDAGNNPTPYKEWIFGDPSLSIGGNITYLDKEGEDIIMSDQYSEQPDGGP